MKISWVCARMARDMISSLGFKDKLAHTIVCVLQTELLVKALIGKRGGASPGRPSRVADLRFNFPSRWQLDRLVPDASASARRRSSR